MCSNAKAVSRRRLIEFVCYNCKKKFYSERKILLMLFFVLYRDWDLVCRHPGSMAIQNMFVNKKIRLGGNKIGFEMKNDATYIFPAEHCVCLSPMRLHTLIRSRLFGIFWIYQCDYTCRGNPRCQNQLDIENAMT